MAERGLSKEGGWNQADVKDQHYAHRPELATTLEKAGHPRDEYFVARALLQPPPILLNRATAGCFSLGNGQFCDLPSFRAELTKVSTLRTCEKNLMIKCFFF